MASRQILKGLLDEPETPYRKPAPPIQARDSKSIKNLFASLVGEDLKETHAKQFSALFGDDSVVATTTSRNLFSQKPSAKPLSELDRLFENVDALWQAENASNLVLVKCDEISSHQHLTRLLRAIKQTDATQDYFIALDQFGSVDEKTLAEFNHRLNPPSQDVHDEKAPKPSLDVATLKTPFQYGGQLQSDLEEMLKEQKIPTESIMQILTASFKTIYDEKARDITPFTKSLVDEKKLNQLKADLGIARLLGYLTDGVMQKLCDFYPKQSATTLLKAVMRQHFDVIHQFTECTFQLEQIAKMQKDPLKKETLALLERCNTGLIKVLKNPLAIAGLPQATVILRSQIMVTRNPNDEDAAHIHKTLTKPNPLTPRQYSTTQKAAFFIGVVTMAAGYLGLPAAIGIAKGWSYILGSGAMLYGLFSEKELVARSVPSSAPSTVNRNH